MNCNDILSQHQELQAIVFRLPHRGLLVEAVLSCLLPGGLAVEITAPRELAGIEAHCCHIPAFGYPTLRGYVYKGMLTSKAVAGIRRSLALRIDAHLFLIKHGAEVRKLFKKVSDSVYREAAEKGPELYDYTTFRKLRAPLLRRYKSGRLSAREYQQALGKIKAPWKRHDEIYRDVKRLFNERLREEFPELRGRVYPQEIFSGYYQ